MKSHRILWQTIKMLVTIALVSGCESKPSLTSDIENEWRTLTSSSNGFSINYPPTWTGLELPNGNHGDLEVVAMLISPSNIFPGVLIARKEVLGLTVQDVAKWGENRITTKYSQYQLDELQDLKLNEQTLLTRTYITDANTSLTVKSKDVYIARGKDGIILTLRSKESEYEDAVKIFDAIVKSFDPLK